MRVFCVMVIVLSGMISSVGAGERCLAKTILYSQFWVQDVITVNGKYFMTDTKGRMLSTYDGKEWDIAIVDKNKAFWGLAWNGHVFVTVSLKGGGIYRSFDGQEWQLMAQYPVSDSRDIIAMRTNGNEFLLKATDGSLLVGDKNAEKWEDIRLHPPNDITHDALWVKDRYLILSSKGYYESTDGRQWTNTAKETFVPVGVMTWGNGHYVVGSNIPKEAGGKSQQVFYSTDLTHWNQSELAEQATFFTDIVWSGKKFVIVGTCGILLVSEDAKQWQVIQIEHKPYFRAVASNGESFMAVGRSTAASGTQSTIFFSQDGEHWVDVSASVPKWK